ncbi:MAG: YHS domain-containing protein [Deltaproteobacteria bacterium]|nr:YHS domain-containing protein [Deltaproteobacteria bacterium]
MAKDPLCGMEVNEEGAKFMVHFGHETYYFCSEKCKESYEQQIGLKKPVSKKGFLEKLAEGTQKATGGKPPKCH